MKKLLSVLALVIFATGMIVAQDNQSDVRQTGDGNTADAYQEGSGNILDYGVMGDDNTFDGDQLGMDNMMVIDQESWFDMPDAYQAYNNLNMVSVYQEGDENWAYGWFKGDENTISFTQMGNGNSIGNEALGEPYIYEGDYSNITIEQVNGGNMAEGEIHGTNQDINVYQESLSPGNYSEIYIMGSLGGGTASQTVDIDQSGENESYVAIYGNGNTVKHNQYGEDGDGINPGMNMADTYIEGDDNMSDIEQEGQYNEAYHYMAGSAVYGNVAETEQDGEYNLAVVDQMTNYNTAIQVQDAYAPSDDILDTDASNEAEDNQSYIVQAGGDYNTAETYQFGDRNVAGIMQEGANNTVVVDQGIWDQRPSVGEANHGYDNVFDAQIAGDDNSLTALQDGFENVMEFDLYTTHDGSNSRNIIDAYQLGGANSMKVQVKGDDNTTFDFDQLGHANVISGLGDDEFFFYEGDEATDFTIYQFGLGNQVDGEIWHGKGIDLNINQQGYYNYAEVDAMDWNNVIDIDQVSPQGIDMADGNKAFIYQRGGGNSAVVNQNGTNNTANVTQIP